MEGLFLLLQFLWIALAAAPQVKAKSSWAAEDEQEQRLSPWASKWEHRTGLRRGELIQRWKILQRLLNTKAKMMPQEDPECKFLCGQHVCRRPEAAPVSSFSRGICSGYFAREERGLVGLWIWFQVVLSWDEMNNCLWMWLDLWRALQSPCVLWQVRNISFAPGSSFGSSVGRTGSSGVRSSHCSPKLTHHWPTLPLGRTQGWPQKRSTIEAEEMKASCPSILMSWKFHCWHALVSPSSGV